MAKYVIDGISRGVGASVRVTFGKVDESRRYVYDIGGDWKPPSPAEHPESVIEECIKVAAECIQKEAGETFGSSVDA